MRERSGPLTNGPDPGGPKAKNIRIRIRNTAYYLLTLDEGVEMPTQTAHARKPCVRKEGHTAMVCDGLMAMPYLREISDRGRVSVLYC
jgi:hypothetical protein